MKILHSYYKATEARKALSFICENVFDLVVQIHSHSAPIQVHDFNYYY